MAKKSGKPIGVKQKIRTFPLAVGDRVDASKDESGRMGRVVSKCATGFYVRLDETGETQFFAEHNLSFMPTEAEIAKLAAMERAKWSPRDFYDRQVSKSPEVVVPLWTDFVPETLQQNSEIW